MVETQITNNEKLSEILPMLREQFDFINSDSVKKYEEKLSSTTDKALSELSRIIEDGTLALDPEQLVAAVKVLSKAKSDITENKRKLIETLLRGEVMIKALDQNKEKSKGGDTNALMKYLEKQGVADKAQERVTSIFQQVNELEES